MSASSAGPVVQVALPTRDFDSAKEFYGNVLGLPLLFEAGGMAFFAAGSVRLMLGPGQPGGGGVVYFQPDDIAGTAEDLAGRGVTFMGEPVTVQRTESGGLQIRFFQDPDGNQLALMGEVAHG